MKIGQQINFIVINKQANSLYSLIADGQYRATSLGRNTWKTLIGLQGSLQSNCDKEGFNTASVDNSLGKARIGILGNNENDCIQCDSRIGFGTGGRHDDTNTCGNEDAESYVHIKAMGYILVQWARRVCSREANAQYPQYLSEMFCLRSKDYFKRWTDILDLRKPSNTTYGLHLNVSLDRLRAISCLNDSISAMP